MFEEFVKSGQKMNPLMPSLLLFSLNLNKSYTYIELMKECSRKDSNRPHHRVLFWPMDYYKLKAIKTLRTLEKILSLF